VALIGSRNLNDRSECSCCPGRVGDALPEREEQLLDKVRALVDAYASAVLDDLHNVSAVPRTEGTIQTRHGGRGEGPYDWPVNWRAG
jgi:hypothetical protein